MGTPVEPDEVAMKMTSSSGTEHISPKKLPTCWVSRSVFLSMKGNFSRSFRVLTGPSFLVSTTRPPA